MLSTKLLRRSMYIVVRLLKGFPQPLIYRFSQAAKHKNDDLVGRIISVPLKTQEKQAVILKVLKTKPDTSYQIRDAGALQPVPDDAHYHQYVVRLAQIYFTKPLHFYQRLRFFVADASATKKRKRKEDDAFFDDSLKNENAVVTLTDEQQHVVDSLSPFFSQGGYMPSLLHGVTGSGKTEVYKKLIEQAHAKGKSVMFLCPEVSLARQFTNIFRQQLSDIKVFGFYSGSTLVERRSLWKSALQKEPVLIVGVHLPVLLPLANLGGIIVDEEHETGFLEKNFPAIDSKRAALLRAKMYDVPILLGSATPSVATFHVAKKQGWKQFALKRRFSGAFPQIVHATLATKSKRRFFWFSSQLVTEIKNTLARGEQVILYINRRGFSFFAQCTKCGHSFQCKNCDVNMTVHVETRGGKEGPVLRCHYCDACHVLAPFCPECKAPEKDLTYKGLGTQQVVAQLKKVIPGARVGRADTDVSRKKKEWKQTIEAFTDGELDILVGTQIITKGYHFPRVTLVGVLWADSSVHFPVYNAHEVALQQLIQVAGRAGRVAHKSTVIIQSFDQHQLFSFIDETKYIEFCKKELEVREMTKYPPMMRLVYIEISHKDERVVDKEARSLLKLLQQYKPDNVVILGPAAPPVSRVQRSHIRKIILKCPEFKPMYQLCSSFDLSWVTSTVLMQPE